MSEEAGIHNSTLVFRYSNGASPYGILDMAGNVSEWCVDWSDMQRPKLVLRGGSFLSGRESVRCTSRDIDSPSFNTKPSHGFRDIDSPSFNVLPSHGFGDINSSPFNVIPSHGLRDINSSPFNVIPSHGLHDIDSPSSNVMPLYSFRDIAFPSPPRGFRVASDPPE